MELSAPYLAAQVGGDLNGRVLVVNPETDASHIMPVSLADALYLTGGADVDSMAKRVASAVGFPSASRPQ
jgi:hypothetical protein